MPNLPSRAKRLTVLVLVIWPLVLHAEAHAASCQQISGTMQEVLAREAQQPRLSEVYAFLDSRWQEFEANPDYLTSMELAGQLGRYRESDDGKRYNEICSAGAALTPSEKKFCRRFLEKRQGDSEPVSNPQGPP